MALVSAFKGITFLWFKYLKIDFHILQFSFIVKIYFINFFERKFLTLNYSFL